MDKKAYINILIDSLVKKELLIDELIEITKQQTQFFSTTPLDMEKMDQSLSNKDEKIQQINLLDNGFEKTFISVKEELQINTEVNEELIIILQKLIERVIDKGIRLEILEKQNKSQITTSFLNKRKEIGKIKMNNTVASSYYRNMSNQSQGQSYFLDKKK